MATRYTPFNGRGGESFTTDAERLQFADAQRQAAMQTLRGAAPQVDPAAAGPQAYDPAAYQDWRNRLIDTREQKQRLMQEGGNQDRQTIAASDVGMNYRADAQMKPSLMGAEDERQQLNEGKPLRDLVQQKVLEGAQGGAGTMSPDQLDQLALLGSIANKQPLPNLRSQRRQDEMAGLQMDQFKRQQGVDRIQQALDAGDNAAAEALGASLGLPVPKVKFGSGDADLKTLGEDVGQFGVKDNNWFGSDPNEQDVNRLDTQAEQVVQLLMRDHRMPEQEARRIVNQAIQKAVAPNQGGLATGWIDTLLQKRGLAAGAPAAAPGSGIPTPLGTSGRWLSGG